MRILLINAPKEGEVTDYSAPDFLSYDFAHYPPLGLLAIAADIDSRHEVKVLDTVTHDMTIDEVVNFVGDYRPQVLGVSLVSRRLYPASMVFEKVKERMPEVIVVAGGPHINDFSTETMELKGLDYALGGYCEKTFPDFIDALENRESDPEALESIPGLCFRKDGAVFSNPQEPVPTDLDSLPFPKRELVDLNDYFTAADQVKMTTVYTSRGCPYKCTFCDVQDKTYHYRSAKSTVDEFEYIRSLGIEEIHIFDDTFNMGRKRVIAMCEEILRRGVKIRWSARVRAHPFDREMLEIMKEAGCVRLQCGIESLHPESLKAMKKKITLDHICDFFKLCNDVKIETFGYFILGFPEETDEYRKNFFKQVLALNPTYIQVTVLYPLPQTQYYEDLIAEGVFERDYWAEFFKTPIGNFNLPPYRPLSLQNDLLHRMDQCYKRFYLSPRFIFRDLKRKTSPKMLVKKAGIALKLLLVDSRKQEFQCLPNSS